MDGPKHKNPQPPTDPRVLFTPQGPIGFIIRVSLRTSAGGHTVIIGIDLGTTNSLAAVFENGAPRLLGTTDRQMLPSVVSLLDDALLVGDVAKTRLVTHPRETVAAFKRGMGTERDYPLGKRKMTAVELSAMVLKHLREMAEEDLGQSVRDAVISVPAYFNQLQRKAVYTAAQIAELNPVRLINEPTAAAIAYGLQDIRDEGSLLVFDLGGGTFDVSIIEVFEGVIEVRATAGDAFLGGEDFTKAIADHIADTHDLKTKDPKVASLIWGAAETLKHRLATEHTAEMSLSINGHDMTIGLTRDKFAEISESLIERLQLPVQRALHDAGLGKDDVGRVVLVGGATRMHLIRGLVARLVHSLPEIGIDPDHVVALGAAVQAGLTSKDSALDDVVMTDVTAFSLGINTSHQMGEQRFPGYFTPIIERNTTVPVSRQQTFTSVQKGQQKLDISIYQGEAPMVDQNIKIGALEVPLPRNLDDYEDVEIRFTYNVSGLLEIDTKVVSNGATQSLLISELAGEMTDAEVAARQAAIASLKVHPKDIEENIRMKARIERCYASALDDDRIALQSMLVSFQTVIERQNDSEIATVREEISSQLDMFEAHYVR